MLTAALAGQSTCCPRPADGREGTALPGPPLSSPRQGRLGEVRGLPIPRPPRGGRSSLFSALPAEEAPQWAHASGQGDDHGQTALLAQGTRGVATPRRVLHQPCITRPKPP